MLANVRNPKNIISNDDDKITTVAVVSDTHSFLDPRIEKIVSESDYNVHAGEICGVGVIQAMKPKLGQVIAVAENNDHYCHFSNTESPETVPFNVAVEMIAVKHGHKNRMSEPSH